MGVIAFAILMVIVLALILYAINLLPIIQSPFKEIIMALFVILFALIILSRAGVITMMMPAHSWIDLFWLDQMRDIKGAFHHV